jgi:hypothetical protein
MIARSRKGAVLAEFAIAFMPICTMFLVAVQLSRYLVCRMVVTHAAEVSARACAVIIDPDPGHDKHVDGPDSDVQTAAHMIMTSFGGPLGGHEIRISDPTCTHVGDANGGIDTVKIDATYTCDVPVAKRIVCSGGTKTFTITTHFPHQGAEYTLDP